MAERRGMGATQWAVWIFGGVVAIVSLTSGLFQIFGVTVRDLVKPQEAAAVDVAPVDATTPPVKTQVGGPAAPLRAPVTPASIDAIAVRVGPMGAEARDMAIYDVTWRGDGATLKFDARRFHVVRFERDGAQCAITVPVMNAWGPAANSADAGQQRSQRTLALRHGSEEAEAESFARRVGLTDFRIETCDAVAARVGEGGVKTQRLSCNGGAFAEIGRADWEKLAAAHAGASKAGVAIRTSGLYAPPADTDAVKAAIAAGRYCGGENALARVKAGLARS